MRDMRMVVGRRAATMSAGDTAPVEGVAFTSVTSVCVEVKDGGRCEREGDVRRREM